MDGLLSEIKAACTVVFLLLIWPLCVGMMYFVCVGGPLLLIGLALELVHFGLTKAMIALRKIPYLGYIISFPIVLVVEAAIIGCVALLLALPVHGLALCFITGEAADMAPGENVGFSYFDFYVSHFHWLADYCDVRYLYGKNNPVTDNPFILLWKACLVGMFTSGTCVITWLMLVRAFFCFLANVFKWED